MTRSGPVLFLLLATMVLGGCAQPNASPDKGPEESEKARQARESAALDVPRIHPETHLASGRMLEEQGNFQGAITQYEKAIALRPDFAPAYNSLGILYQRLGRPEDAEQILRQGIKARQASSARDPSRPDAALAMLHNNLGVCHLARTRFAEAERCFRTALTISPNFQRARMNLAISLAHLGQTQASLATFAEVVPDDVAHYNLAAVLAARGDQAGARHALEEALKINPDCPGAREQLARLQSDPDPNLLQVRPMAPPAAISADLRDPGGP